MQEKELNVHVQKNGEAEGKAPEQEMGAGLLEKAQKIADAMVARKLKNMPSKEEIAAFREWQAAQEAGGKQEEQQKTPEEGAPDAEKSDAFKTEARLAAAEEGIARQRLADAALLILARTEGGMTMAEAAAQIAEENPQWTAVCRNLPAYGANPAVQTGRAKFEPPMII